jgi:hypothetical protein
LSESTLRVPVLYDQPGLPRETRTYVLGLEDVLPALARVADIPLDDSVDGRSFLLGPVGKDPVSMADDPLRLSVRSGNLRYQWTPQVEAFGEVPMPGEGESALYRVGEDARKASIAGERQQLVENLQERLAEYVRASYAWRGEASEAVPVSP